MDYIILDLEWNQPLSYNSSAYKSVGGKLLFEMIQIGAIRMNERLEITDSFNQLIQPTHYVKLHPRIRRITGISQDDLADAPQFCEAAERFHAWCGEDSVILTWGCDDISVFQQNLDFFKFRAPFPPMYDLQRLYGELVGDTKNRAGLKSAMERFAIEPDGEHPFHNALNDAYYTGLVFQRCPQPQDVLRFPQQARKLTHEERARRPEREARPAGTSQTLPARSGGGKTAPRRLRQTRDVGAGTRPRSAGRAHDRRPRRLGSDSRKPYRRGDPVPLARPQVFQNLTRTDSASGAKTEIHPII